MFENKKWVMGIWKFSDKIPKEELGEVANKWATEDPKYLQLYVRKTSKDQYGIGFTYEMPQEIEDTKKYFDDYTDRAKDILYKRFGTGLVGWDIASDAWLIK